MKTQRHALSLALVLALAAHAHGAIQTQSVAYEHEGVTFQGFLAYDDAIEGARPAVLVSPEWWGLNDYARSRALQLAQLGYVAFAVDMYGEGKTTEDPAQAGKWAGELRGNLPALRGRARAAMDVLTSHDRVDADRVAIIGYCFGGNVALQLAYSGANIRGAVSFHGNMVTPEPADYAQIKARILVCHGAADTFIPDPHVIAFQKVMDEAKADWQLLIYAGAVHSFTNPDAGKRGMAGVDYQEAADRRSWQHMQMFFNEIFQ